MKLYVIGLAATFLILWLTVKIQFVPKLGEVMRYFGILWSTQGLMYHLLTSIKLFVHAVFYATVFSCVMAYLTVIPAFNPVTGVLSSFRFLSMTGLVFFVQVKLTGGGYDLKFWIEWAAISAFLLTALYSIVQSVQQQMYDYAYTLRMSKWRAVWEVTIRGTRHQVLDAIRQNMAIGWMMLPGVEALARGEGGIGVMLINLDKFMVLPAILAIQLASFVGGIGMDYFMGLIRRLLCPYAVRAGRGKQR
ncbi:MAG: hypothetical protein NUV75_01370 [Gallionella sp.]|nr:hypothetical protein [Gallionella sp.]